MISLYFTPRSRTFLCALRGILDNCFGDENFNECDADGDSGAAHQSQLTRVTQTNHREGATHSGARLSPSPFLLPPLPRGPWAGLHADTLPLQTVLSGIDQPAGASSYAGVPLFFSTPNTVRAMITNPERPTLSCTLSGHVKTRVTLWIAVLVTMYAGWRAWFHWEIQKNRRSLAVPDLLDLISWR